MERLNEIEQKRNNVLFQEYMQTFDKSYIREVFEEGVKLKQFPKDKEIQGIRYIYDDGYLYSFTRKRINKMRFNNEGRLDIL